MVFATRQERPRATGGQRPLLRSETVALRRAPIGLVAPIAAIGRDIVPAIAARCIVA
jgi:hypothetical protein